MKHTAGTRIATLQAVCNVERDDIIDACRLFGFRTIGGLILRRADLLPESFYDELHRCADMRQAAEARRAS